MNEIRTGIKLTGDASGLNAAFTSAGKGAQGLNQELRGVSSAVGQLAAGVVSWQLGKQVIAVADEMSVLNSRIKLVTGSINEQMYVQGQLFAIAQQSRTSYTELGATYAQIARATGELNISQSRLLGVTQSIGQAMAIGGGSAQSMNAALIQLSQGLASGTLRGEELNSIMEQTPRLATAIAQGMGVSLGQLRALGADGKLTALAVIEALEKSAPALRREFEQVTPTISQAFTTAKNSSSLFIAAFDQATGSSKTLSDGLTGLSKTIDSLGETFSRNKETWSMLASAATWAAGLGAAALAFSKIGGGIVTIGAAIAAHPVVAVLLGVGAAAGALSANSNSLDNRAARAQAELNRLNDALVNDRSKFTPKQLEEMQVRQVGRKQNADALQAEIAVRDAAALPGAENSDLRERRRFAETTNPDGVPFPGAKSLNDVRKYAKLSVDVQREAYDQAADIAKSYQNSIKLATTDEDRVMLTKEMNARLVQVDKDAKKELKTIAEQGASEAKALNEAQFSEKKARLELVASIERQAMDQQVRTNEQLYKLNLVDVETYYDRKSALALEDLAITERLTQAELQQAQALAAAARKQDDKLQATARVVSLERELIELATKRAAIEAEPDNLRMQRLKAQEDEYRAYAYREKLKSATDGYGQAGQLESETTRLKIGAIRDPQARDRASLAEDLRLRRAQVDAITDPDAREMATERYNNYVVAKNAELEERLKPGWQRMADSWGDTTTLMRDSFNSSMDSVLKTGEDAFVQIAKTGKLNVTSMVDFAMGELARLAFRQMAGGIAGSFGEAPGGGGGVFGTLLNMGLNYFTGGMSGAATNTTGFSLPTAGGRADGGPVTGGAMYEVNERGPELLQLGGRQFLMMGAQDGNVVPISSAQASARALGGGGGSGAVQVNIYNQTNAKVETKQRQNADGGMSTDVIISQVEDALADRVSSGTGSMFGAMSSRFGLNTAVR